MFKPKLKMRLGDLLVHEGIITQNQLHVALSEQQQTGSKLGRCLINLKLLTEEQLLEFLAQQLKIKVLDIRQRDIDPAAVALLPEVHARRFRALVLEDRGHEVLLGMSDPADLVALDRLTPMLAPKDIAIAIVPESQLMGAFDRLYRRTKEIEGFANQLKQEYSATDSIDFAAMDQTDNDNTISKLLQSIFEDAVQMRASDIHIEPDEKLLRIRQRVDGVLQENILKEVSIASALVLRLKLMAQLDISEKRLPQDGRFQITVKGRILDVRISTMPVQYGESAVMRLLDQSAGTLSLEQTGMPESLLKRFRPILKTLHGLILVTGPTGSGKTTSLYGMLGKLNQAGNKIITAEDPVEYRLSRINQVQINHKIGLTFSSVLRTSLRQDPDIIMVGEMRDHETAEIGLRAALTGHLVLSTLHTNDAISSVLRLVDMGVADYLVASALRAVLAQRLVRCLCSQCKKVYEPDAAERSWLAYKGVPTSQQFWQGEGCQSCNRTGYSGRVGVFELLVMNHELSDILQRHDLEGFAQLARDNPDFRPLGDMALDYAMEGVTSLEEVIKVSEYFELNDEPDAAGKGAN